MSAPFPWQQSQWQHLQRRAAEGRLAHGLLLQGPAGTGKNVFAERFAQSLLCTQPQPDGNPCGACQACLLVTAGSHPDLLRVQPEEDSKVIRVDQIRGLTARLASKSQFGGYRVACITPAERLNTEAANSMLKTLEEPGADTVLLLVSAQPARLPITVRSRCQSVAFPLPAPAQASAWLAERHRDMDPAKALALANGAPLAALQMLEEGGLEQRDALFQDFVALLEQRSDPVLVAGKWQQSLDLERGLGWIGSWVCDMIRLQVSTQPPVLGSIDRTADLARLAGRIPVKQLFRHLDRLNEARRLLQTAVSPQAILELVLIPLKNHSAGR